MKSRISVNNSTARGSHSGKGNGGLYGGWHPTQQARSTEPLKDRLERGCSHNGQKSVGYLNVSKKTKSRLVEMGILTIPFLKKSPRSQLIDAIGREAVKKLEEIFAFQEGRTFRFGE